MTILHRGAIATSTVRTKNDTLGLDMKKRNIGSSFDGWLREEGIYEEATTAPLKRVLALQVEAAMKEKQFSKAEMARRMHTSRAALDRLLDPEYDTVNLSTLRKRLWPWAAKSGLSLFRYEGVQDRSDISTDNVNIRKESNTVSQTQHSRTALSLRWRHRFLWNTPN